MTKKYPLFFIDRSKFEAYPFDYVICMDTICGFVAKTIHFEDDLSYNNFLIEKNQNINNEYPFAPFKLRIGSVVLQIEDYIYNKELTPENLTRVQRWLKKGLKKYIHTEIVSLEKKDK